MQVLETANQRRGDEASAEKTRNLLTEIRRAVYPIQNVYVTANLVVPRASLPAYAVRLDKASLIIAKAPLTDRDVYVDTDEATDKPSRVGFSRASKLYPASGSLERSLLVTVGLEFRFYKKPIDVNSIASEFTLPDAGLRFLVRPTEAAIEYFPQRGMFQSVAMNMEANAKNLRWYSNGRIASLLDLDGAQLIVRVEDLGSDELMDVARSTIEVLSIDIDIGGRRLFMGSGLAKAPKADPKTPIYSFLFPHHLLEADEYLGQDKSANDKIRARAASFIERRTQ